MMRAMPLRGRRVRGSAVARLARPLLSLGILTAGLVIAGAFVGVAIQGSVVDREADAARSEIARLEAEVAAKREEAERRKGQDYVIDTARDYGYVRPGEGLIEVQRDGTREAAVMTTPNVSFDRVGRWIRLFFGVR